MQSARLDDDDDDEKWKICPFTFCAYLHTPHKNIWSFILMGKNSSQSAILQISIINGVNHTHSYIPLSTLSQYIRLLLGFFRSLFDNKVSKSNKYTKWSITWNICLKFQSLKIISVSKFSLGELSDFYLGLRFKKSIDSNPGGASSRHFIKLESLSLVQWCGRLPPSVNSEPSCITDNKVSTKRTLKVGARNGQWRVGNLLKE